MGNYVRPVLKLPRFGSLETVQWPGYSESGGLSYVAMTGLVRDGYVGTPGNI